MSPKPKNDPNSQKSCFSGEQGSVGPPSVERRGSAAGVNLTQFVFLSARRVTHPRADSYCGDRPAPRTPRQRQALALNPPPGDSLSLKDQEADVIPVASPSAQHLRDGGSRPLWLLEGLQGRGGCLQGPEAWLPGGLGPPWGQTPKPAAACSGLAEPAAPGPAFMGTKSHRQPSAVRARHSDDARSTPRPLRSTTFH